MHARTIEVRVLLVSGDIQTVDTLRHFMEKEGMRIDVCSDIDSATRRLSDSKFEALVVDFKDTVEAFEMVERPRQMPSHKAAVVLAILNNSEQMPGAFRAGANFVLVRPLSLAALMRTLRACYPLMVRERRRYFRCPLQIPTYISVGSRSELIATSANISEGGMAITNSPALELGEKIVLRLKLPGTHSAARINAEVCWSDDVGRAGMRFVRVSRSVREQLQSWLAARLEESSPEETVLSS